MKRKGLLAEASNNDNASLDIARSPIWRGHKLQRRRKRLGDTESSHEAKVSNNTFASSRLEPISDNSEATGIATEAKGLPQTISYDFSELSAASVKCEEQKRHKQRHVIGSAATRHRRRKTSMLQSVESAMISSAAPLSNWQGQLEEKSIRISPREMELAVATCLLLVAPFLVSSIPSLSNHETHPSLRICKQNTEVTTFDFDHVSSTNHAGFCPDITFPSMTACVTLSVSIGFLSGTVPDTATNLDRDKCHAATAQKCEGTSPHQNSNDAQIDYQAARSDKLEPCRLPQDVAVISLGPQSPRLLNGCNISVKADKDNIANTQAVAMVTPAPPTSQHFQQCSSTSQGCDKPVSTTSAINTTSEEHQSALDTSNRYTAEKHDIHAKAEMAIDMKQAKAGIGAHPQVPYQRTNGHLLKKRTRETITESRSSILQKKIDYKRSRVHIEADSKRRSYWHDAHSIDVRSSIKQEHGDSFYRFEDFKPRLTGAYNYQHHSGYRPETFQHRNQSERNSFSYEPSSSTRYEDRTHISCMFSPVNTSRKSMCTMSALRDFKWSFPPAVTTQIHNKKYGAFIRTNETDPADEEVTEIAKKAWDTNMAMTLQNNYMVSRQIQGTNNKYNYADHHNYRRYGYHPTNYNQYNRHHHHHHVSNRPNNPMAALFNYVEEENREYQYSRRAMRTHHHNWSQEHQEPQRDYNDHHHNHRDYFICIERGHPRSESPMSDITVSPAPSFDDDNNEPLDKNVDPNIFSTLPLDLREDERADPPRLGADNLYSLNPKQKEFRHEHNRHHKRKDNPETTVSTPNSSFWKNKNNPNLWVNTEIYNQGPAHASCMQQPPAVPRVSPLKMHNRNFVLSSEILDGDEPLRTVSPIRAFTFQERGSRIGCKNY